MLQYSNNSHKERTEIPVKPKQPAKNPHVQDNHNVFTKHLRRTARRS
jgi:hypothetical protein